MNLPPLPQFIYSLKNQGSGAVDIHIDGDIVDAPTQEFYRNYFGDETSVSFKSFRDQLEAANPSTINLYVNSLGGAVSEAMAMHDYLNELENKGVKVNRKGRGIIASAATYLMMGNNSEMSENSMMMIHNIQMTAQGDINDVEQQVKMGRKFNNLVRDFYVNETGQPPETISSWMNKATWFSAKEAKDNGFVNCITGQVNFKNKLDANKWPFDKAILNHYNSFTTNKNNMKVENLTAALANALKNAGIIRKSISEETLNKVCGDMANSFKKEFDDAVKNISGGVSEDKVNEMVQNALANILKQTGPGSVAAAINSAAEQAVLAKVPDATKLATTEAVNKVQGEVTELKKEVANKLGGKANEKTQEDSGEVKNGIVKNKRGAAYAIGGFGN